MTNAVSIREVMDPYEWLPGYGESSVEIRTSGTDLLIDVGYEDQTEARAMVWRSIVFRRAVYFCRSSIPNPADDAYRKRAEPDDSSDAVPPSCLVAFDNSALASSWSRHFSVRFEHFRIIFTSENVVVEAVAERVSVSEPVSERVMLM